MKKDSLSYKKFPIRMQKKLVVLFFLVLLAFAGLVVQLGRIRGKEAEYQKKVLSQQKYDSKVLPFKRGDIVDAKGNKLATCTKVYNLVIDASVMSDKEDYYEPTMQALEKYFPMLDMSMIRQYVRDYPDSAYYVPVKRLTYEEISGFQLAQQDDSNIKGIWFEEEYKRIYPNGKVAADVVGFSRTDNVGQYGMEEYYNEELNGTNGREYGYLNDDLVLERTIKPATDGNTIHSTIDLNIQKIAEKYVNQFCEENRNAVTEGNGAENVGCVIMEVNTGNILAMASAPGYDLNNPKDESALIGSKVIEKVTNENGTYRFVKQPTVINQAVLDSMTDEEKLINLNQLWKNFCIASTYEPGSTMKPFTVAAGLESGAINDNTTFQCGGSLEIGGHNIHCHNKYGDGTISLETAVATSCNVALMKIGQAMGKETFCEFQNIFNFGLKTNVDLAGEARTADLLFPEDIMGPADLATNTFGQNFNVTMIQMITGFCSLINGGYYYEPHIVDKITNSNGAVVKNIEPRVLKQTVSGATSALIRRYCTAVVTRGTGKTARPAGYLIGGKTGTAETYPRKNREYVVSFMGFAPAENPQIAIYVVVDRANKPRQDDAKYATQIVRNVLTEVLPYMNIFMTEELSEKEIKELEEKQLQNTLMYSTPDEEEGENPEGGEEGQGEGTEAVNAEPLWKSFEKDPTTGNYIDPTSGEQLDPDTGEPVNGNADYMGDVPANPAITGEQAEGTAQSSAEGTTQTQGQE